MKKLVRWKWTGLIAIVVLGSLMHFIFDWSGQAKSIGWLLPVNESVWEHLKMGYWPVLLYSLLEYRPIIRYVNHYFLAKLLGILAFELSIIVLFYSYTALLGKDVLLLDITVYLVGAINCQWLTYRIFSLDAPHRSYCTLSLVSLVTIAVLFGITTYQPPHCFLFRDSNTNTYGIPKPLTSF